MSQIEMNLLAPGNAYALALIVVEFVQHLNELSLARASAKGAHGLSFTRLRFMRG